MMMKIQSIKTCGMQLKQCLEEIYSFKYLYQEKNSKISDLSSFLKKLETPKQKERRTEINVIETKTTKKS